MNNYKANDWTYERVYKLSSIILQTLLILMNQIKLLKNSVNKITINKNKK